MSVPVELAFWIATGGRYARRAGCSVSSCRSASSFASGRGAAGSCALSCPPLPRRGRVVRPLVPGRYAEVEVEYFLVAGSPGEAPAHALLIGTQFLDRRARDADHRHVAGLEVGKYAVEAVGGRRARGTSGLVAGTEHEVVDHQLRAAVKQLSQCPDPVFGLERVLLHDWHPGKLAALPGEFIAHPREFLLAL